MSTRKRISKIKKTPYKRKYPSPQIMHDGTDRHFGRFNYGWFAPFDHNDPRTKILNHLLDIWWEIDCSLDFTDIKMNPELRTYFRRNILPMMDDFRQELEEYFKQDPRQQKRATLERLQKELEEMGL